MDRKRIRDEIIEILCNKLHNLPPPSDEAFDYEHQALVPDITKDPLDIAEVAMDLEDAFGVNFEEALPGDPGMETIGKVIEYLDLRINGASVSPAAPAHAHPAKGKSTKK
jgi:acyl carrier protein